MLRKLIGRPYFWLKANDWFTKFRDEILSLTSGTANTLRRDDSIIEVLNY